MSRQYSVEELKNFALLLRRRLGLEHTPRPDMRDVLIRMKEVFPDFDYRRVRDNEVKDGEGFYDPIEGLKIPDRTFVALERQDNRARYSIAHEIAHWVLAHPEQRFRHAAKKTYERATPKIQRDERQAEQLAAFFLAPDHLASSCTTVEELQEMFGLSHRAAVIRKRELDAEARRKLGLKRELPPKVIDLFQYWERKGYTRPQPQQPPRQQNPASKPAKKTFHAFPPHYIDERCPACGEKTLLPLGNKFMCDTCHNVSDRFQDGDLTG